jgi:membrane protease YdiL (CAAX protease family)
MARWNSKWPARVSQDEVGAPGVTRTPGTRWRPASTLGLALRPSALPGALLGALVGAVPVALSVAVFAAPGAASVRPAASFAGMLAPAALAAVAATALLSVFEELLWRGYAFQLLIEGTGRWPAVLLTSSLWAFGHSENPGANVAGALGGPACGRWRFLRACATFAV